MPTFTLRLFERPGGRGTVASLFEQLEIEAKNATEAVEKAVALADSLPANTYSADLFGEGDYPLLHMDDFVDEPEVEQP